MVLTFVLSSEKLVTLDEICAEINKSISAAIGDVMSAVAELVIAIQPQIFAIGEKQEFQEPVVKYSSEKKDNSPTSRRVGMWYDYDLGELKMIEKYALDNGFVRVGETVQNRNGMYVMVIVECAPHEPAL